MRKREDAPRKAGGRLDPIGSTRPGTRLKSLRGGRLAAGGRAAVTLDGRLGLGLGLAAGAGALDLGGLLLPLATDEDGGEQTEGDGEGEEALHGVLSRCLVSGLSSRADPDA